MRKKTIARTAIIIATAAFISIAGLFASHKIAKHIRWKVSANEVKEHCSRHHEMHRFYVSDGCSNADAYIAHGGGINDFVYTNSQEAVRDSLERGFRFIEIDMRVTADGHIVGIHDWSQYSDFTGKAINPSTVTLEQIKGLKIKGKYALLEGKDIARIMEENPDLILVTDKINDYNLLLREIPYPDRMIVEVFTVEDYARALRVGVKYPAFCLWRPDSMHIVETLQIPIVTMDAAFFFNDAATIATVQRLHDRNVTILLFSAGNTREGESADFVRKYLGKTVSKIYTDKWAPSNHP